MPKPEKTRNEIAAQKRAALKHTLEGLNLLGPDGLKLLRSIGTLSIENNDEDEDEEVLDENMPEEEILQKFIDNGKLIFTPHDSDIGTLKISVDEKLNIGYYKAAMEEVRNKLMQIRIDDAVKKCCRKDFKNIVGVSIEEKLREGTLLHSGVFSSQILDYPEGTEEDQVLEELSEEGEIIVQTRDANGRQVERVKMSYSRAAVQDIAHDICRGQEYMGDVLTIREIIAPAAQSAAARIHQIRQTLDAAKTTGSDSPEYTRMLEKLTMLDEELSGKQYTNRGLAEKMKEAVQAADNYYFAKLTESHNTRRSIRFCEAQELRQISECLKQNKEYVWNEETRTEQLKESIAAKWTKDDLLQTVEKDPHRAAKAAEILRPENRAQFEKLVKSVMSQPVFKEYMKNKSAENLRQISCKNGREIRRELSRAAADMMEKMNRENGLNGPVN